jgi:hypothetical protein
MIHQAGDVEILMQEEAPSHLRVRSVKTYLP